MTSITRTVFTGHLHYLYVIICPFFWKSQNTTLHSLGRHPQQKRNHRTSAFALFFLTLKAWLSKLYHSCYYNRQEKNKTLMQWFTDSKSVCVVTKTVTLHSLYTTSVSAEGVLVYNQYRQFFTMALKLILSTQRNISSCHSLLHPYCTVLPSPVLYT